MDRFCREMGSFIYCTALEGGIPPAGPEGQPPDVCPLLNGGGVVVRGPNSK